MELTRQVGGFYILFWKFHMYYTCPRGNLVIIWGPSGKHNSKNNKNGKNAWNGSVTLWTDPQHLGWTRNTWDGFAILGDGSVTLGTDPQHFKMDPQHFGRDT